LHETRLSCDVTKTVAAAAAAAFGTDDQERVRVLKESSERARVFSRVCGVNFSKKRGKKLIFGKTLNINFCVTNFLSTFYAYLSTRAREIRTNADDGTFAIFADHLVSDAFAVFLSLEEFCFVFY